MKRRYKMQRTPSYYKNWCTTPFFLLESGDGTKHVLTLLVVEMVRGSLCIEWRGLGNNFSQQFTTPTVRMLMLISSAAAPPFHMFISLLRTSIIIPWERLVKNPICFFISFSMFSWNHGWISFGFPSSLLSYMCHICPGVSSLWTFPFRK